MNPATPTVHVIVAGVLRRHGRALMVHRCPQRRWYPNTWDLPGGPVVTGKAPPEALARTLGDHLGITAQVPDAPFAHVYGAGLRMSIWLIDQWTGEPFTRAPLKHDALAWMTDRELYGLQLADSRLPRLLRAALHPHE